METIRSLQKKINRLPFKSYYVVWKLRSKRKRYMKMSCLNRTMQYGNCLCADKIYFGKGQFKSYYVVWKPTKRARAVPALTSLNRTMQYGNLKSQQIQT